MNKFFYNIIAIFLYKVSGGKIKTRTFRESAKRNIRIKRQNSDRIQALLDTEHINLRGWDSTNYEDNVVIDDKIKEANLLKEIKRTQKKYSNRKKAPSWL